MSIGLIAALVADILAVTPVPQNADTNGWWMQRHFAKIEDAKKCPPKVVFVGDSITHFWEQWHYGYIQWDHYFKGEPYKALNLGFSADRTEHVLWRLDHGELDGYEAKAVVLMIGTNNLGHRDEAPIDTIIGIRRVVEKIREKQPAAKVILCGILPRGKGGRDSQAATIARINRALAAFADGRNVVFCDFGERMLTADGRLLRGIMPDLLHPAGEGYEIWANAVIPYVNWALTAGPDALPMASLLPTHVNPDITDDDCAWHQGVPQSRINRCVNTDRSWWWLDRMAEKRREIAELGGKVDLVFLGDSITHNWEGQGDGAEELAALRKKYSVVDLGYGADGVHHLLWRLEMGELDGYEAKGIMMMIGTNNNGEKGIVPVIAKMLDLIRRKQPKAKVLLCGMLPLGCQPTHGGRKPRAETNVILKKLAAEKDVEWLDFGDKLLDEKGFMPTGGMWNERDWVHPKAPGYRIWRAEAEPIFDRWFTKGKAKPEKVVEGTLFVPPSGPAEKQTLAPDPVELYAGPAVTPKGAWRLSPGMARIDGNILTVEVNEKGLAASKGHAYPSGRLKLDLSDFRGGIEVSIRARAENVVGKRNPMTGFKFQLPYTDRLSGQPFWAEPRGCVGTFGWKTFTFKADLSTKDVPSAELTLGLQDATGKAVYDLSTLTVRPLRGAFPPVTNRDYRQVYSDRVKAWPQLRGAMLPPADAIREKDVADLRTWGATLVRYQMGTAPGENAADLAVYRKWVDRMADKLTRDLIPWARKHGLRICVDLHSKPGGRFGGKDTMMFYNRAAADCFVESWQKFARQAKGNGDVIYGYDLANEPMQTQAGVTDYFSLQKRAAEAIRAIDPETPIIVESNMMDSPEQFPYLPALELKDVIYQVHMYVPGGYTHQGLGSAGSPARPTYPDPERGWDREFLKKALRHVRDFEQRHGARIFVGEFSAMCYAEGADRYIADCISIFKEYGWDWTYHAFREWDGWSVEHTTKDGVKEPKNFIPSLDNPRKRALLRGLKGE